jgi:hypothetical protein
MFNFVHLEEHVGKMSHQKRPYEDIRPVTLPPEEHNTATLTPDETDLLDRLDNTTYAHEHDNEGLPRDTLTATETPTTPPATTTTTLVTRPVLVTTCSNSKASDTATVVRNECSKGGAAIVSSFSIPSSMIAHVDKNTRTEEYVVEHPTTTTTTTTTTTGSIVANAPPTAPSPAAAPPPAIATLISPERILRELQFLRRDLEAIREVTTTQQAQMNALCPIPPREISSGLVFNLTLVCAIGLTVTQAYLYM